MMVIEDNLVDQLLVSSTINGSSNRSIGYTVVILKYGEKN